jgi:hypothetical protein
MRPSLLTFGNPKTAKGEARGWLTAVLHLAPANSAGLGTVCASASAACIDECLNTAGRGGIMAHGATTNAIQEARKRRTAFYKLDPEQFAKALANDIARAERKAARLGLRLAVRVNGTSDLPMLAHAMAKRFPHVVFYDYTKHANPRARELPNYHLTFSRAENNELAMLDALHSGVNAAVVFSTKRGRPLPTTWRGRPVIDGDAHDLRFLDPRTPHGIIVGLRAKGRARRDTSGFVVNV